MLTRDQARVLVISSFFIESKIWCFILGLRGMGAARGFFSYHFSKKGAARNTGFEHPAKIWRQPTLAEAIQPLPSARLRLTAEFGMGSGRTTALWPPKIIKEQPAAGGSGSLKTIHRQYWANSFASLNHFSLKKSDQASRPISISPL